MTPEVTQKPNPMVLQQKGVAVSLTCDCVNWKDKATVSWTKQGDAQIFSPFTKQIIDTSPNFIEETFENQISKWKVYVFNSGTVKDTFGDTKIESTFTANLAEDSKVSCNFAFPETVTATKEFDVDVFGKLNI